MEVSVQHRIGPLALNVAFTLMHPWNVLFAPSGAGKSTLLRVIAGLVEPDAARIVTADRTVLVDTTKKVSVATHRRAVRFVGQHAALFPHLSVRRNVLYGSGSGDVDEVMELCRVQHLAGKMPKELSGGERQRVALARALAAMPARVLLLDEPFSGLDVSLRDELVSKVKVWLAARVVPVLHVTHDVGEVFALQAEVIRMAEGRVVAQGPAEVVLRQERNRLIEHLSLSGTKVPQAPVPG